MRLIIYKNSNFYRNRFILLFIFSVIIAVVGIACSSSENESDAYFEQLAGWNRGLIPACGPLGTTVEERTLERPMRCNEHVAQLDLLSPPNEHRTDHLALSQSSDYLVTIIGNVERLRPSASRAASIAFPNIWRQQEELNRYYRCTGSDDYWGYGQSLFDAPGVVYDLVAACRAEQESFSQINLQSYAIMSNQKDN
jgi:hypothetical protein